MRRHELTDEQWELIGPMLPQKVAKTGRPPVDRRLMLNGIFWILATGAPWRDLPGDYGHCKTVYNRHRRWSAEGTWAKCRWRPACAARGRRSPRWEP